MKHFLITSLLCVSFASAAPTELRKWQATGGHETEAKAIAATPIEVTLLLNSGNKIQVPLEKLIESDQAFILDHFGIVVPKEGEPLRSNVAPISQDDVPYELGKIEGPISSKGASNYYIYVPKSLKKGRPAPLLHYNGSGGGDPGKMKAYVEGCERFGWVMVASKESSNSSHGAPNLEHAGNNLAALKDYSWIDSDRVYFTGGSGGGAMSFWNFAEHKGAGTMPFIGYIPGEVSVRGGHHFIMGGARDYNRYHSAAAAKELGKDAVYRPYPGFHSGPKKSRSFHEGLAWLHARFLEENESETAFSDERLDFEAATIDWINELKEEIPHLAYQLAIMLRDTYEITGQNSKIVDGLIQELAADSKNVRFTEGLEEIQKFATKELILNPGDNQQGLAYPDQSRKAERLAEDYAGVPYIETIFREFAQTTQSK